MQKHLTFILLLLLLSGCANRTVEDIKKDPSLVKEEVVHENYQVIYRRTLDLYRRCFTGGLMIGSIVAEANLYTDIKVADIAIVHYGLGGSNTYLATELKSVNGNTTLVTTRAGVWGWKRHVEPASSWANGTNSSCK